VTTIIYILCTYNDYGSQNGLICDRQTEYVQRLRKPERHYTRSTDRIYIEIAKARAALYAIDRRLQITEARQQIIYKDYGSYYKRFTYRMRYACIRWYGAQRRRLNTRSSNAGSRNSPGLAAIGAHAEQWSGTS